MAARIALYEADAEGRALRIEETKRTVQKTNDIVVRWLLGILTFLATALGGWLASRVEQHEKAIALQGQMQMVILEKVGELKDDARRLSETQSRILDELRGLKR